MAIAFTVLGVAQPKGSAKIVPLRRQFPVLLRSFRDLITAVAVTSDNPAVKRWQKEIAAAARAALAGVQLELAGAIALEVRFYLPRPKSLAKRYHGPHLKKPDTDKCLRSVFDALTGVVWKDDAQVTDVTVRKAYAELDEPARVEIRVSPVVSSTRPLFR